MTEQVKEVEIKILSRKERGIRPRLGVVEVMISTVFMAEGTPPQHIQIPKEDWTEEKEEEAIKKQVLEALKVKPIDKTFTVSLEELEAGD